MATATGAKLLIAPITTRTSSSYCSKDSADVDYTLLDCGANYGYWSVLVSSKPFGSHKAIAIEPSGQNFPKLANNAGSTAPLRSHEVRGSAPRAAPRVCRATKHEAFSIAGDQSDGEEVPVLALDNLLDDGKVRRRRQIS